MDAQCHIFRAWSIITSKSRFYLEIRPIFPQRSHVLGHTNWSPATMSSATYSPTTGREEARVHVVTNDKKFNSTLSQLLGLNGEPWWSSVEIKTSEKPPSWIWFHLPAVNVRAFLDPFLPWYITSNANRSTERVVVRKSPLQPNAVWWNALTKQ